MFNLYLEELRDKYKNYKFAPLPKEELGIQANVSIGKLNKDGVKKVRYLKTDFKDQKEAFREILGYTIIQYINKAYKAYGFKTSAMPIPLDFDWEVSQNRIELSTSGVGSTKKNSEDLESKKQDLIDSKYIFVNALIGNSDAHGGNVIYKTMGKNYAIDFAYAFYDENEYGVAIDKLSNYLEKIQRWGGKKEIARIQKQVFFWMNFLKLNKNNLIRLLIKTMNEIISKFTDAEIISDIKEYFPTIKINFLDNINDLIAFYEKHYDTYEEIYKGFE